MCKYSSNLYRCIGKNEHTIAASCSSSNDDNNMSLDANQEEAPTSTHDTASSSVVPQRRGNVPS
jgi:hypothetical protein